MVLLLIARAVQVTVVLTATAKEDLLVLLRDTRAVRLHACMALGCRIV